MKILLADDSDLVRDRLRDLLVEISGVQIAGEARSTHEAIQLAEQLSPDLMFLNFQIPGGAGLETLKKIKALPSPPCVVILSDNASPEYQETCRRAGADYIYDKAIDIPKIQSLVRGLIR